MVGKLTPDYFAKGAGITSLSHCGQTCTVRNAEFGSLPMAIKKIATNIILMSRIQERHTNNQPLNFAVLNWESNINLAPPRTYIQAITLLSLRASILFLHKWSSFLK